MVRDGRRTGRHRTSLLVSSGTRFEASDAKTTYRPSQLMSGAFGVELLLHAVQPAADQPLLARASVEPVDVVVGGRRPARSPPGMRRTSHSCSPPAPGPGTRQAPEAGLGQSGPPTRPGRWLSVATALGRRPDTPATDIANTRSADAACCASSSHSPLCVADRRAWRSMRERRAPDHPVTARSFNSFLARCRQVTGSSTASGLAATGTSSLPRNGTALIREREKEDGHSRDGGPTEHRGGRPRRSPGARRRAPSEGSDSSVAGSIWPAPPASPAAPAPFGSSPAVSYAEKIAPKIATPNAPPIDRVNIDVLDATPMSPCLDAVLRPAAS